MTETASSESVKLRPVIFGEILFDHFPDGSRVAGGAPFNVAWHLAAFGLNPLLISALGPDQEGRELCRRLSAWGMDTSAIEEKKQPTGRVEISFKGGEPQFAIVPEQAYDFITTPLLAADLNCGLLYHGSLALRSKVSRQSLLTLRQQLQAPVFLDVNLRPPWWQRDTVISLIEHADWVKLNQDELAALSGSEDLSEASRRLLNECGPRHLFITRGANGAVAITAAGEKQEILPGGESKMIDPVGAGDAFSSVLILGLLRGWSLRHQLAAAQDFAEKVIGLRGATSENADFYAQFKNNWGL